MTSSATHTPDPPKQKQVFTINHFVYSLVKLSQHVPKPQAYKNTYQADILKVRAQFPWTSQDPILKTAFLGEFAEFEQPRPAELTLSYKGTMVTKVTNFKSQVSKILFIPFHSFSQAL